MLFKIAWKKEMEAYLYMLPWVTGFVVFWIGPLLYSVFLSLTKYSALRPPEYIGLANYQQAFVDPLFYKAVYNTLYYMGASVTLGLGGSLGCALLLNHKLKGISLYRTIFFLPSIVPVVAATLVWIWILEPTFGLANYGLSKIGIEGPKWFQSTLWAMPGLILISLWRMGGQPMLIFLAGLQGIPTNLYEAAKIDGSSWWQDFIYVTLPMLTPAIFFNLLITVITSFGVFAAAFIATGGGPAYTTLVYVLYLYQRSFKWFELGYGSALAWLMFFMLLAATFFYFRYVQKLVYYAGEKER